MGEGLGEGDNLWSSQLLESVNPMSMMTRIAAIATALTLVLALSSCGGSDDETSADTDQQATEQSAENEQNEEGEGGAEVSASEADTTVSAELGEYYIKPDAKSVDAGNIQFDVTNDGSLEHEFVVIKTDTPAADLPLVDGNVDEEAAGEVPGEIGSVEPGANETVTLSLDAGKYALICNLPGHYKAGQYAEFQVG